MAKIGICFGGYCPMHQGHLDIIMRAKKENDICFVVVCGYDNEPRADEVGLPLRRRITLVRKLFKGDEQVKVLSINDTELGLDESMCPDNWRIWLRAVNSQIQDYLQTNHIAQAPQFGDYHEYTWYVGEQFYKESLESIFNSCTLGKTPNGKKIPTSGISHKDHTKVVFMDKVNDVSGTIIRKNPLKYWDKIAWTFRPHFSTNILITGTASEGKSTLTRDIANYFAIPYSEEVARGIMAEQAKLDPDLTVNDFIEFIIEQRRDTKHKIDGPGNHGLVISDTDALVTLMYALAYTEDNNIDFTKDDYDNILYPLAKTLQRGIKWDRIFLIQPHNKFVDDGSRYMAQSSLEERWKNYEKLEKLLDDFGWSSKITVLNGTYLENFNSVKEYIEKKMVED